jgi:hypothetical protein
VIILKDTSFTYSAVVCSLVTERVLSSVIPLYAHRDAHLGFYDAALVTPTRYPFKEVVLGPLYSSVQLAGALRRYEIRSPCGLGTTPGAR